MLISNRLSVCEVTFPLTLMWGCIVSVVESYSASSSCGSGGRVLSLCCGSNPLQYQITNGMWGVKVLFFSLHVVIIYHDLVACVLLSVLLDSTLFREDTSVLPIVYRAFLPNVEYLAVSLSLQSFHSLKPEQ